jgi:hypothetical protein
VRSQCFAAASASPCAAFSTGGCSIAPTLTVAFHSASRDAKYCFGSQRDLAYSAAPPHPAFGVSLPPTTTLGPQDA